MFIRWAGRAGPATGPAEADADYRHFADTGLGEAGHKSPVRERCVANVIHFRPTGDVNVGNID